jgi:hypothetical protein
MSIKQPSDYDASLDEFWTEELKSARQNGNMLELRGLPEGPDDVSGGVSSSASRMFQNQPFRFEADRQRGCTSVWLLNKKGLWAAHFWEVGGMGMVDLDEQGQAVEQDLEILQATILGFISNGNASK